MKDSMSLYYKFSLEELKALAMFLRPRQSNLPKELFAFARAIQDQLYGSLSIAEVENFYKK